jgi:hypothetical protein
LDQVKLCIQNFQRRKRNKSKSKKRKNLLLPSIDTNLGFIDQSGRQYASAKKPMARNLSENIFNKNPKNSSLSARKNSIYKSKKLAKNKNTFSLPKIDARNNDSALSDRIQGYTGIAKTQAAERKKLESYFKSLDKAVQILRQKRQNELANRPWVPTGPIHQFQYRPSSKYG